MIVVIIFFTLCIQPFLHSMENVQIDLDLFKKKYEATLNTPTGKHIFCNIVDYAIGLVGHVQNINELCKKLVEHSKNGGARDGHFSKSFSCQSNATIPYDIEYVDPYKHFETLQKSLTKYEKIKKRDNKKNALLEVDSFSTEKKYVSTIISPQLPSIFLVFFYFKQGGHVPTDELIKRRQSELESPMNEYETKFYAYVNLINTITEIGNSKCPFLNFPYTCTHKEHKKLHLKNLSNCLTCISDTKELFSFSKNNMKRTDLQMAQDLVSLIKPYEKAANTLYDLHDLFLDTLSDSYIDHQKYETVSTTIDTLCTNLDQKLLQWLHEHYAIYYRDLSVTAKKDPTLKRRHPIVYGPLTGLDQILLPDANTLFASLLKIELLEQKTESTSTIHIKQLSIKNKKIFQVENKTKPPQSKNKAKNLLIKETPLPFTTNSPVPETQISIPNESKNIDQLKLEMTNQNKIYYKASYFRKCLSSFCKEADYYHGYPVILDIFTINSGFHKADPYAKNSTRHYWPIVTTNMNGTSTQYVLYLVITNINGTIFHRGPRKIEDPYSLMDLIYNGKEDQDILTTTIAANNETQTINLHEDIDHELFTKDDENLIYDNNVNNRIKVKNPFAGALGSEIIKTNDIYIKIYAPFIDKLIFIPRKKSEKII